MDSEQKVKELYECDLCEMLVRNIKVHKKLNHKKAKQKLSSGFSVEAKATSNILQNKKKSTISNYFLRRAEIHQLEITDKMIDKMKTPKQPVNKEVSEALSSLSDYVYSETVNHIGAINDIQASCSSITPSNTLSMSDITDVEDRKEFELQLNLLGLHQMSSIVKRSIEKLKVEQCPECKGLFQVNGRVSIREFREHVGVCGLGGAGYVTNTNSLIIMKEELDDVAENKENPYSIILEPPTNTSPNKMRTDVLQTDTGLAPDFIKTSNSVMLESNNLVEVKVEPCDVEVKVEIKNEPMCEDF